MRQDIPLVIIPTYNESENIRALLEQLLGLNATFDILAVDDNSPDGTGSVLDSYAAQHSRIKVIHRPAKLGIGSAHKDALRWAYANGYALAITMDADFTHRPDYILKLLSAPENADVVITSRFLEPGSLPGWNKLRKALTRFGHVLTRNLLALPYDATGALRLYRLDRIPQEIFLETESDGYSFFFESLFRLARSGKSITEIPIALPARTYGTSKMKLRDVLNSVRLLVLIFWRYRVRSEGPASTVTRRSPDADEWNQYWSVRPTGWWAKFYGIAAQAYRVLLIRPALNFHLRQTFEPSCLLLHAGCGGGQTDVAVTTRHPVIAADFSLTALTAYAERIKRHGGVIQLDVRMLPFAAESFDGIYNLGVMEHFTEEDIAVILREFRRILKRDGKLLLFWPPEYGVSVIGFKALRSMSRIFLRRPEVQLHPLEISRLRSRRHAAELLERGGFQLEGYSFGPRDMFTQVAVLAVKR